MFFFGSWDCDILQLCFKRWFILCIIIRFSTFGVSISYLWIAFASSFKTIISCLTLAMTFSNFMKSISMSTTKAAPIATHSNFSSNIDILIFSCLCMAFYPFQEDLNSIMFNWTKSSAWSSPSIVEIDVTFNFYAFTFTYNTRTVKIITFLKHRNSIF